VAGRRQAKYFLFHKNKYLDDEVNKEAGAETTTTVF
jgi:hypothetical protein